MQRSLLERAVVLAALVLVLLVNWLANALPLAGLQTGEVSSRRQICRMSNTLVWKTQFAR